MNWEFAESFFFFSCGFCFFGAHNKETVRWGAAAATDGFSLESISLTMCILYLTATSGWPSHAKCHAVLGRPVLSLPSVSSLLQTRRVEEDMASLASFPRFKMAIVVVSRRRRDSFIFRFYFFHLVSHQVATDRCLLQADVIGGSLRRPSCKQTTELNQTAFIWL
jgi:hypothetical protein